MKKTLLAAALLTGFAGAASAQNSVTLYGVVSVGLQYQSLKAGSNAETQSQFKMAASEWNSSRWGLKGVEDLGNGLKASFVYESGINPTDGSSSGFTRQATLGLENSSWGKVQFGRAVSPGTVAFSGVDPFGASFGTSSQTSTQANTFIRYNNLMTYATPNISGFSGIVGYSFDVGGESNSADAEYETNAKNRAASAGLRYANGPILVAGIFDYVMSNDQNVGQFNDTNIKTWAIGGSFDFKVAKVHGSYGQTIDGLLGAGDAIQNLVVDGGSEAAGDDYLFAKGARAQSWMVGLTAPLGSGSLMASVQQQRPGGDFDIVGLSSETVASIGYKYNLSKRTGLYGFYSYSDNTAMVDGATANTIGVGVRHLF